MALFEKTSQKQMPQQTTSAHTVADAIAPQKVEVDFKTIRVGNRLYRTFFVAGYPRYVSVGWLSPVIDFDHSLYISMFVYPIFTDDVLSNLKRKIAEMEATMSSDEEKGKPENPKCLPRFLTHWAFRLNWQKVLSVFSNLVFTSRFRQKIQ